MSIVILAGAAIAAQHEALERQRYFDSCIEYIDRFNAQAATVPEKQHYAQCVETIFPLTSSSAELWLIRGAIILAIMALAIGIGIVRNKENLDFIEKSFVAGFISIVGAGLPFLAFGIYTLIAYAVIGR